MVSAYPEMTSPVVGEFAGVSQLPRGAGTSSSSPQAIVVAFQDRLSQHVETCFDDAKRWKDTYITPQLEDALRRRKGEYDATKLAQIRSIGGCETYFNLTETKSAALEAWLHDVLLPLGDRPWALSPTPLSDLPANVMNQLLDDITAAFGEEYALTQVAAAGLPPDQAADQIAQLRARVQAAAVELEAQYRQAVQEEAQRRADAMTEAVADQLEEGDWREALGDLIHNLATFQLAVLKGPVLEGRRRMRWVEGGARVVEEPQVCFRAVSPWDIYPSPHARHLGEDWLCEVVRYPANVWRDMASAPGWSADRVGQALAEFVATKVPQAADVNLDGTRADLEGRPTWLDQAWTTLLEGVEYWGVVPGEYLLDWVNYNEAALGQLGFGRVEAGQWYPVTAVKLGRYVVKVGPVLDPLGKYPYWATSFEKVAGSLWGRTVGDKIKDCQDSYAATLRAMINNLGFASGPSLLYDADVMDPISRVQPFQTLPYHGRQLTGGSRMPVEWWQQSCIAEYCLKVAGFFSDEADNRSGIPRYQHGEEDTRGAGETARGLSMLMGAAAKGIKRTLTFLDRDVLRPALEMLVRFNNAYARDARLKGDVRVVARGALYVLTREAQTERRGALLGTLTAPAIQPFVRPEGVAHVLREQVAQEDLPADKVVKTDEEIKAWFQQQALAALAGAGPGGGNEAGGGKGGSKQPAAAGRAA